MTLFFRESLERDIWNWRGAVRASSYGVDWKKFLTKEMTAQKVQNKVFLRTYLTKRYYASGKVSAFKQWLERHIDTRRVSSDLERLLGKKFLPKPITVFITTFRRAPYDVEACSYFLTLRETHPELSITATYHELMHFLFHWHYWGQCKKAGLSDSEIHDLKESLTVLLNPILKKRGLPLDFGYPNHRTMRDQWKSLYRKERSFSAFMKKALPWYKDLLTK